MEKIRVADVLRLLDMAYPAYRIFRENKDGEYEVIADDTTAYMESEPLDLLGFEVMGISPTITDECSCLNIYVDIK